MLPGISSACFYPEQTESAVGRLASWGVRSAEIFFNAFMELEDPFLRRLSSMASDAGVQVLSVHPFTSGFEPLFLFSTYRRRTEEGLEFYKRYFHAANLLGAHIVVIHGDHRYHNRPRSFYFDIFGELARLGASMGVIAAQENVPRCIGWCPDFFREMRSYLPDARFVLDVKQCLRAGFAKEEMARAMGAGICHLHLSDHRGDEDCLPVGRGEMDTEAFLRLLCTENGFDGGVIQEVYRDNYSDPLELLEGYRTIERFSRAIRPGRDTR